jgi:hypothetical protein
MKIMTNLSTTKAMITTIIMMTVTIILNLRKPTIISQNSQIIKLQIVTSNNRNFKKIQSIMAKVKEIKISISRTTEVTRINSK